MTLAGYCCVNSGMITITTKTPWHSDAIEMLEKSCAYIRDLYPSDHAHTFNLDGLATGKFFLVCQDEAAVGCGASVYHTPDTVELKHIFLDPAVRGRGLGKILLRHLEQAACQYGFRRIVLETGTLQPAAYGLYRAFGYQNCQPFIANPLAHAIFMEKFLPSII